MRIPARARGRRRAALVTAVAGAIAIGLVARGPSRLAAQSAQNPPPPAAQGQITFRAEANFIEVDAIVTDAQGKFVRDLSAADFEVLENKKPQTVDVFSLVDIPLERADRPLFKPNPIPPDVATNERPFEGRLWVLVLDSHHIPPGDTYRVKRVARLFVEKYMGANDLAAVVHSQTGKREDSQEFTSNKTTLLASIDKFIGEQTTSRAQKIMDAAIQQQGSKDASAVSESHDPDANLRAASAKDTLSTLMQVSRYMAGVSGRRKAVLFVSEGLDVNLDDTMGANSLGGARDPLQNSEIEAAHAADILDTLHSVYQAASRGNVAIFSIDPRGVGAEQDNMMQMTGTPEGLGIDIGSFTGAAREQVRRDIGVLRNMSDVTGGIALVSTNNYDDGFRNIVNDNSAYYVLGYHPPSVAPDGKFHEITVRVKRPGLQVRARKGYYAVKPGKDDASAVPVDPNVALLNSPIAVGGLGLRVTAGMAKGAGPKVAVHLTVEVSGDSIGTGEKASAPGNKVEFAYAIVDMGGALKASGRRTMDLSMNRPESRLAVAEHGLRLVSEVALPPGHYQLRLAGRESVGGKAGSVFTDLDVPDFSKGPLVIGNLILTSTHAGQTPTSIDAPSLSTLLPGPPTASREFGLDETLVAYAEIADNDLGHAHMVDLTASLKADDGTQVFVTRDERSSDDVDKASGTYKYLARLPLQDLVAGTYVLTVEARSRLGNTEGVSKEIVIKIK